MEQEIDQEYQLMKYALTYLISNLNSDIAEDMSDYIGTNDFNQIQDLLQFTINNY
jgi:hypothetical protein